MDALDIIRWWVGWATGFQLKRTKRKRHSFRLEAKQRDWFRLFRFEAKQYIQMQNEKESKQKEAKIEI